MPIVVTPEIDSCAELWLDPVAYAADKSISVDTAEQAILSATWTLWNLTGGQFHGYQCWLEDYKIVPGQRYLQVDKVPLNQIIEAFKYDPCAETETEIEVCLLGASKLCLPRWCQYGTTTCSCTNPYVRIRYSTKPNLPFGVDRMVALLADEYIKLIDGRACALPERITSISRQGIQWSLADITQYLERSTTGIDAVDQWLTRIIGNGVITAVSPLYRGILMSSELYGCGEDCGTGEEFGS